MTMANHSVSKRDKLVNFNVVSALHCLLNFVHCNQCNTVPVANGLCIKLKRIAFLAIASMSELSLIFLATVSAVGERASLFKSSCTRRHDVLVHFEDYPQILSGFICK